MCDLLSHVLLVRDFIKMTGGKPEEPLNDCMIRLKLRRGLSDVLAKAVKSCRLCHMDSLASWLRLVRAIRLARNGQDAFAGATSGPMQAEELPEGTAGRKMVEELVRKFRPDVLQEM